MEAEKSWDISVESLLSQCCGIRPPLRNTAATVSRPVSTDSVSIILSILFDVSEYTDILHNISQGLNCFAKLHQDKGDRVAEHTIPQSTWHFQREKYRRDEMLNFTSFVLAPAAEKKALYVFLSQTWRILFTFVWQIIALICHLCWGSAYLRQERHLGWQRKVCGGLMAFEQSRCGDAMNGPGRYWT